MAFVNLSTGCTNSKEDFNAYYSVCRVLSPKKKKFPQFGWNIFARFVEFGLRPFEVILF